MEVRSKAFDAGRPIPEKYSQEKGNTSPQLTWAGSPEGTREFAVICEDPDAPGYVPWVHWLVWGIPGNMDSISEGEAGDFKEGKNSNGRIAYSGPMPPPGHGPHHYHFKVFALDEPLDLERGANKDKLVKAMEGHVLDQGEVVGTYERP
jgi:Raf kinase inhibitor-like YbhB/YbcL family protein